jgi:hypothetical protein
MRKDDPTPAYSPVSDRRRLTALVEVHWARRVQAPMPQISGPNLQENQIIETYKDEGCAVSTQETFARRKWEMEIWHFVRGFQNDHATSIGERRECRAHQPNHTHYELLFQLCCCSLLSTKQIFGDLGLDLTCFLPMEGQVVHKALASRGVVIFFSCADPFFWMHRQILLWRSENGDSTWLSNAHCWRVLGFTCCPDAPPQEHDTPSSGRQFDRERMEVATLKKGTEASRHPWATHGKAPKSSWASVLLKPR